MWIFIQFTWSTIIICNNREHLTKHDYPDRNILNKVSRESQNLSRTASKCPPFWERVRCRILREPSNVCVCSWGSPAPRHPGTSCPLGAEAWQRPCDSSCSASCPPRTTTRCRWRWTAAGHWPRRSPGGNGPTRNRGRSRTDRKNPRRRRSGGGWAPRSVLSCASAAVSRARTSSAWSPPPSQRPDVSQDPAPTGGCTAPTTVPPSTLPPPSRSSLFYRSTVIVNT